MLYFTNCDYFVSTNLFLIPSLFSPTSPNPPYFTLSIKKRHLLDSKLHEGRDNKSCSPMSTQSLAYININQYFKDLLDK